MSVLIKGMEMPTSCDECPCFSEYDACDVTGSWKFADEFDKGKDRLPDCPLVHVPPHGRLIDADALTKMCREMQSIDWNKKAFPYSWEHAYEEFENDIDEAPTVIEAEDEP